MNYNRFKGNEHNKVTGKFKVRRYIFIELNKYYD
jgi:hypothetical protein